MALVLFAAVSCGRGTRIIPKGTMSKIYADMFVADQWLLDRKLTRDVDTVLIYEPVFRKYGYTSADFYASVDKYIGDTERFSRMLKESEKILDERVKELEAFNAEARKNKEIADKLRNYEYGYPLYSLKPSAGGISYVYVPLYSRSKSGQPLSYDNEMKRNDRPVRLEQFHKE